MDFLGNRSWVRKSAPTTAAGRLTAAARIIVSMWTKVDAPISGWIDATTLYGSYAVWAKTNEHRPLPSNTFGERMGLLGLASKSDGRARRYAVRLA